MRLAQARLGAAQAARDNAALQLSYTRVTAPVAGIVSRKQVEVGQLVQAGQPLLTVVSRHGRVGHGELQGDAARTTCASARTWSSTSTPTAACTAKGKVESVSAATGAKFALLPPDNATGNFTKVVQRVPVRIARHRGAAARIGRCGPACRSMAHVAPRSSTHRARRP